VETAHNVCFRWQNVREDRSCKQLHVTTYLGNWYQPRRNSCSTSGWQNCSFYVLSTQNHQTSNNSLHGRPRTADHTIHPPALPNLAVWKSQMIILKTTICLFISWCFLPFGAISLSLFVYLLITIWLFNIANGKSPFLIGKLSINRQFSMAMLNNQRLLLSWPFKLFQNGFSSASESRHPQRALTTLAVEVAAKSKNKAPPM
jgi:hypothetical protein